MTRKVFLETFGCQMNTLDSQLVRSRLRSMGYEFVDNWRQADVVLYNTCSVREHAEQKAYSRLGEVGVHKRRNPNVVLGVIGCMAQQRGYDLARQFGQLDLMCAPGELDKLPQLIDDAIKADPRSGKMPESHAALQPERGKASTCDESGCDAIEQLELAREYIPAEHNGAAYVRITRGCNKFCSYCVVPYVRGPEVHRSPDNVVEECRRLVEAGVIEITLLGQTVNHYQFDHGGQSESTFAQLLRRIHDELPALHRLRFVTSLPRDFGDDIIDVMADCRRICRYLHLPVQSGSDRMLKLMNRGYTVKEYDDLLTRARAKLPGVQIASDLICGFPTETDEDHEQTCNLLRRSRLKNCFIFKYSPRPGTAAARKFDDDVPDAVKRRRNAELLAIQGSISTEIHSEFVGKGVSVFVESISAKATRANSAATRGNSTTQLAGRTEGDLIVLFEGSPKLVGSIVDVQIEHASRLELFGSPVHQNARL